VIPYLPDAIDIDPRCRGLINRVLPPLPACETCGIDIAERFAMGFRRCEQHEEQGAAVSP
jgi:hypothetical protein